MSDRDLTGRTFWDLKVTAKLSEKIRKEEAWLCDCRCGEKTTATRSQILTGRKKSCGCRRRRTPANALDLRGKVINGIKVIDRSGKTARDNALWLCECKCGNKFTANATTLRRGEIVSCGCERTAQAENARNILQTNKTVDGVAVPLLTKRVRSDSGTGHKGIYKRIRRGREYYEANITVKGKRIYAAPEKTLDAAIAARKLLEDKYHKPYIDALEDIENGQGSD